MRRIQQLSDLYLQENLVTGYPSVVPTVSIDNLSDANTEDFQKVLRDFNEAKIPTSETFEDWNIFQAELLKQYYFLLHYGFSFEFTEKDPYPTAKDLYQAVYKGETIRIYSDGSPLPENHPSAAISPLGVSYNVLARAVHDIFGHMNGETYCDFSTVGEMQAYRHHMQLFSTRARRAFFTDFPAQSVWVEANNADKGPVHLLPFEDLTFAPQKFYRPVFWC